MPLLSAFVDCPSIWYMGTLLCHTPSATSVSQAPHDCPPARRSRALPSSPEGGVKPLGERVNS